MTCVVVLAHGDNKKFFTKMAEILGDILPTIVCHNGEIKFCGQNPELILCDRSAFSKIDISPSIIICEGSMDYKLPQINKEKVVAIADSSNQTQLEFLSEAKLPTITCGMHGGDTITLSSATDDTAVINLQRKLTCFNGQVVEPQEFPVDMPSVADTYFIMVLAAILVLTGNSNRLVKIWPQYRP